MHKNIALFALIVASILMVSMPASAQEQKEPPEIPERQFATYHLELSINELADGKKINSRHYSLNVAAPNGTGGGHLNIGSRVPVMTKEGEFTYLDIGTSIEVRLSSYLGGPIPFPPIITVNVNMSSVADEAQTKPGSTNPLIRQVRLEGSSPVVLDKVMTMASAADPESNHEFQLTVTATKLAP